VSAESIGNAILRWNAVELEEAAAEAGLVMAMQIVQAASLIKL